jgi:hypothetical protein
MVQVVEAVAPNQQVRVHIEAVVEMQVVNLLSH